MPEIVLKDVPDRAKDALLALLESVEKEDEYLRLQQMRQFKKNNLFWHGFQYLFWSDTDMDWRVPTHAEFEEIAAREETRWVFDYVVNHFKAHGESIIAALSVDIPDVRFGPRDSQDPEDRRAVEAADNAAELIEKWNRAKLLLINALFYLATEGFVASYTYHRKDPDFGVVPIPEYGMRPEQTTPDMQQCTQCGMSGSSGGDIGGDDGSNSGEILGGMGSPSGVDGPPLQPPVGAAPQSQCAQCGGQLEQIPGQTEEVPYIAGEKLVPKGREVIEIYGPLSVRVPSYVSKLADSGYLLCYIDNDPALFKGMFTDVADEIDSDPGQNYERLMRQSSLTMDGYQLNIKLATQKKCWFRPWMLNRLLPEFDDIKPWFVENFTTGIYTSFIGQTMCEVRDEQMDKHWSVTKAGPSKGIHADPLLQSEVPLQELRNNLTNLFVMMVEYGVPATYADTEVFDFEGQSKQEAAPGYVYPVTPRPGQRISDAFYSEKTTTLNKESTALLENLTSEEQFVTGSFPSIYGGAAQGGSKTLGEYDKSRAFALQRLGLVYYFVDVWWGETIHKSVESFIDHQVEDEPVTTKSGGDWQTKWIKKAQFKGSFERLEPDPSADFPVSFAQKRQTLMSLAQLNNEQINSVLFSPENAGVVQQYVGLRELKIPSDLQRKKQMREILELVGLEPLIGQNQGIMSPVPVEPDIDDHEIHITVLTDFLVGDVGQDLKEYNPQGYASCLAHLLEHKQAVAMLMMQQMPGAPAPGAPGGGAPPAKPSRPNPVGPPPPEAQTQGAQAHG